MFSKLFGRSKKEDIDFSLGYSRLDEFKNYLTSGNYIQFESEYEQLTWDAKTLLNEGIGLNKDCDGDIKDWVEVQHDSYIANLFAGVGIITAISIMGGNSIAAVGVLFSLCLVLLGIFDLLIMKKITTGE